VRIKAWLKLHLPKAPSRLQHEVFGIENFHWCMAPNHLRYNIIVSATLIWVWIPSFQSNWCFFGRIVIIVIITDSCTVSTAFWRFGGLRCIVGWLWFIYTETRNTCTSSQVSVRAVSYHITEEPDAGMSLDNLVFRREYPVLSLCPEFCFRSRICTPKPSTLGISNCCPARPTHPDD
jgi:hypothetical protein